MKPLDMKRQLISVGDKVLYVRKTDAFFDDMSVAEVTDIGFDTGIPPKFVISLKGDNCYFGKNPSQLLVVTKQLEYFVNEYPELQL